MLDYAAPRPSAVFNPIERGIRWFIVALLIVLAVLALSFSVYSVIIGRNVSSSIRHDLSARERVVELASSLATAALLSWVALWIRPNKGGSH
jgi:hypothetical protein